MIDKKPSAPDFWNWFQSVSSLLLQLEELEESVADELMTQVLEQLHKYSEGLHFLISVNDQTPEMIITAAGNKAYFGDVTALVQAAPPSLVWDVIAFRPPQVDLDVTECENTQRSPVIAISVKRVMAPRREIHPRRTLYPV